VTPENGISKAMPRRVFQRFQQVEAFSHDAAQTRGLGLGLAILLNQLATLQLRIAVNG